MSGRILAKSLVPEPKTSLKCSITCLVSGTKLRFSKKKFTFSNNSLSRKPLEAHGESGRERGLPRRAAGRAHPRGVAGGWRVRKCHFRGLKHLRAVKIFPLARAGERERGRGPLPPAAERVHPHAVAGGWRVWKCHFRGWQHLRAVKIFPLARATTYGPKRKRALFFYKKRADLALSR